MNRLNNVDRFCSLDVLRGVAALSVVLWHWQHFFFVGTERGYVNASNLPLFAMLQPLYTKGWMAVDLFFCLSGFIFYWLYSERISKRSISIGRFALYRFSRLYPLHLLTLVLVGFGQSWLIYNKSHFFVYPNNDTRHFFLNTFFMSSWGFEAGYSFNGPIWSVSVEVLLYSIFFAMCRLLPVRSVVLAVFSFVGFTIIHKHYAPIGRGIGSFFLGGCLFLIYKGILKSSRPYVYGNTIIILGFCVWIATLVVYLVDVDSAALSLGNIAFVWRFNSYFQKVVGMWPTLVLFPATILSLALIETHKGAIGKRLSFIGDISYSAYLLHFPLQLFLYIFMAQTGLDSSIYYSPILMILFYVALIVISLCSYHCVEMPSQRYLRHYELKFCSTKKI